MRSAHVTSEVGTSVRCPWVESETSNPYFWKAFFDGVLLQTIGFMMIYDALRIYYDLPGDLCRNFWRLTEPRGDWKAQARLDENASFYKAKCSRQIAGHTVILQNINWREYPQGQSELCVATPSRLDPQHSPGVGKIKRFLFTRTFKTFCVGNQHYWSDVAIKTHWKKNKRVAKLEDIWNKCIKWEREYLSRFDCAVANLALKRSSIFKL